MPPLAATTPRRSRNPERSRQAILAAATARFAAGGYEGTSLADIGAAAGLSRAAPGYFFGSKAKLYEQVLRDAFARRQQATADAFAPVRAWCEGTRPASALAPALRDAAAGYMTHLSRHPEFTALVMREELAGGRRLRAASGGSTAISDAFAAVRAAGRGRGVRPFDVEEAVLLFVSLTFAPFSYRHTLLRGLHRELVSAAGRARQAELAARQLTALLASPRSGDRGTAARA
jgi:TetR/AcrR family transcriptional regulator